MDFITRKKNKSMHDREDKMTGSYRPWVRHIINNNLQLPSKSYDNTVHTPGLSNQANQPLAQDNPRQPLHSKKNPRPKYNSQPFRKNPQVLSNEVKQPNTRPYAYNHMGNHQSVSHHSCYFTNSGYKSHKFESKTSSGPKVTCSTSNR